MFVTNFFLILDNFGTIGLDPYYNPINTGSSVPSSSTSNVGQNIASNQQQTGDDY